MASRTLAGRYRLQETLGKSLMAEVHAATDLVLDRPVVVKLLAPDADRVRFEREARAAAALTHPNIVRLFDYGEDEGRPYIVFEHLPGRSLQERLSAGPLADADTARIAADVAAGLAHAHEHGVVHRDLKPANVLFDGEDRAKVADFGIAQVAGADTITDAGTILGTAAYISPEQVRGEPATPASDVYAFGVVLYEMLAGRVPFAAEHPAQLAAMHRDAEPPPLASVRPDVPPELAALATAALAKDLAARPPDGAALLAALEDGPPPPAHEAETRVLRRRRPRRPATPLIVGFSLIALLAAGLVGAIVLTRGPSSAPAVSVHTRRSSSSTTSTRASTPATTRPTSQPTSTHRTTTRPTTTVEVTLPTTSVETTLPTTTELTTAVP
jgi:serine/threonine-protein kinase